MGTIFIILLVLISISAGAALVGVFVGEAGPVVRLAAGSVVGLALLAWAGFLGSLALGLNWLSIGLTSLLMLAFLAAAVRVARAGGASGWRERLRGVRFDLFEAVYYGLWAGLLALLFSRVVIEEPDGMHTAPLNNYGDLPFHFSVITSFAYGDNFPPSNPIFAGARFTYPFLVDFLTAFFVRSGAGWSAAFFIGNAVLSLSLVALVRAMAEKLSGSRAAGALAPVLFLFNGGLGFVNFLRELARSDSGFVDFMLRLKGTYTMNAFLSVGPYNLPLRWGNVFTTLLIPQRSMLFGLPFAAMIVALWWRAVNSQDVAGRRRNFLAAGLLAGLLPMLHAHGFFAVMIAVVPMALLFMRREWVYFLAPAGLLSIPQALWLAGSQVRGKLFGLHWGWEAGESNPLLFWAANAGLLILLLLVALNTYRPLDGRRQRFYLPFLLWFIVPNVVLLAPWAWDNIKVLVYWSLVTSAYAAAVLVFIAGPARLTALSILRKTAASALVAALTLSGALDVWRALTPVEKVGIFSLQDERMAASIRSLAAPRAVVLHAPVHNSLVALTGRQSVMGYPGHLWTHGIDAGGREAEIVSIYSGSADAAALLSKYKVGYVLIGPVERSQMYVNEDYFSSRYRLVAEREDNRLYEISDGTGIR